MKTGFWNTHGSIDPALANTSIVTKEITTDASAFLYGTCTVFALVLHDRYGYPIECIPDKDMTDPLKDLCHVYCIVPSDDGCRLYADVRGITGSWEDVVAPFEDILDHGIPVEADAIVRECDRYLGKDTVLKFRQAANQLIDEHPDWYTLEHTTERN